MGFISQLVSALTITSLVSAQYNKYPLPKKYNPATIQAPPILQQQYPPLNAYLADPNQNPNSYLPLLPLATDDQSSSYLPIPLVQQLPSIQAPVPFYTPEPSTVLTAPSNLNKQPTNNFYQVPVPSQELQLPSQLQWNPDNDPKYLYVIPPPSPAKEETPTNLYPKKYSKDVHATVKPHYAKYKENSSPVDDHTNVYKQKKLSKILQNQAKQDNQKRIQAEKVQKHKAISSLPKPAATKIEPQVAETGFHSGFDSEGVNHHKVAGFTQDIHSELSAALESKLHSPKERLEFHMHGHDGPHSYKWGFDHGEGHDRQFRFEERDKSGVVKGLYGYYDKHGKLQMVNYDSHPHEGFHADTNFGKF